MAIEFRRALEPNSYGIHAKTCQCLTNMRRVPWLSFRGPRGPTCGFTRTPVTSLARCPAGTSRLERVGHVRANREFCARAISPEVQQARAYVQSKGYPPHIAKLIVDSLTAPGSGVSESMLKPILQGMAHGVAGEDTGLQSLVHQMRGVCCVHSCLRWLTPLSAFSPSRSPIDRVVIFLRYQARSIEKEVALRDGKRIMRFHVRSPGASSLFTYAPQGPP
jgi:hypothetical protein